MMNNSYVVDLSTESIPASFSIRSISTTVNTIVVKK